MRWLVWILNRAWVSLPEIEASHGRSLDLLAQPDARYASDSAFGDSAVEGEITSWLGYRRGILRGDPGGESRELYPHVIHIASDLISATSAPIFLNLGVCFPHIDEQLARRFPSTHFLGVERTEVVPALNRILFGGVSNLEFASGDVFEMMHERELAGGVLFHARTLTLLSKDFARRLYEVAAAAKIDVIFGCEQFGVSRQTKSTFSFSYDVAKPSVIYRKSMFIHNYPALLSSAGFDVVHAQLLKTSHPDPDYRLFSFVGQRRQ